MLLLQTPARKEIGVVGGYSFWRRYQSKTLTTWHCSAAGRGCKAQVFSEKGTDIITSIKGAHNHEPPKYVILYFLLNHNYKEIAILGGYTFYIQSRSKTSLMWACSSNRTKKCKARFNTTYDRQMMKMSLDHTHDPPKFTIEDGILHRH
ncbi:FLYWCH zinc finger domain-containing protein [Phthorimaea operculella]|nr:FLYWCH zinc finger domain-containing protein [Phthorimaea operculella]